MFLSDHAGNIAAAGTPRLRTTTAMMALRRHMRRITSKAVSSSRTTVKFRLATSPRAHARIRTFQASPESRVDPDYAE